MCMFTACSSSPCLHDGTCILDSSYTYHCACLAGYTGKRCENGEFVTCTERSCMKNFDIFLFFRGGNLSGKRMKTCLQALIKGKNEPVCRAVGMTSIFRLLNHSKVMSYCIDAYEISELFESFSSKIRPTYLQPAYWEIDLFPKGCFFFFFLLLLWLPRGRRWFTVTRMRSVVWMRFRPAAFPVHLCFWSIRQ